MTLAIRKQRDYAFLAHDMAASSARRMTPRRLGRHASRIVSAFLASRHHCTVCVHCRLTVQSLGVSPAAAAAAVVCPFSLSLRLLCARSTAVSVLSLSQAFAYSIDSEAYQPTQIRAATASILLIGPLSFALSAFACLPVVHLLAFISPSASLGGSVARRAPPRVTAAI